MKESETQSKGWPSFVLSNVSFCNRTTDASVFQPFSEQDETGGFRAFGHHSGPGTGRGHRALASFVARDRTGAATGASGRAGGRVRGGPGAV